MFYHMKEHGPEINFGELHPEWDEGALRVKRLVPVFLPAFFCLGSVLLLEPSVLVSHYFVWWGQVTR